MTSGYDKVVLMLFGASLSWAPALLCELLGIDLGVFRRLFRSSGK